MRWHRSYFPGQVVWLALLDVICVVFSVSLGVLLRGVLGEVSGSSLGVSFGEYISGHFHGWVYLCGAIVLANYTIGAYGIQTTISRFDLGVNVLFSLAVAVLALGVTSVAWFRLLLGRGVLALALFFYALLTFIVRSVLYGGVFRSGLFACRTAMMGTGPVCSDLAALVGGRFVSPRHEIAGYIDVSGGKPPEAGPGDAPVVAAAPEELEGVVRGMDADLVIVCVEKREVAERYYPALRRLRFGGIETMDRLKASEVFGGRIPLDAVDDIWLMQASIEPSLLVVRRLKRLFDLLVGFAGAVVLAPVALVVAALVKLREPGSPVIYRQKRVGRFGREFTIFKFRTMVENAEEAGAVWSREKDPRVTAAGRILRRFRLDEIPQVVNILRGDMSVVGPRPERPEIAAGLEAGLPNYRERENVMPGLTGWAQVQYPYVATVSDAARRLEYDLYYVKNMSLRLDLQVILRTLRIVLLGMERSR